MYYKRIRELREDHDKTQKEIADYLNIPQSTFNNWIMANKYPRIDKIEMLSNYFGCLKSDLIEDKQKQPTESELSIRKKEFMQKVANMSDDQIEKLEQILALVESKDL